MTNVASSAEAADKSGGLNRNPADERRIIKNSVEQLGISRPAKKRLCGLLILALVRKKKIAEGGTHEKSGKGT